MSFGINELVSQHESSAGARTMKQLILGKWAAILLALFVCDRLSADVVWDESLQGDLSGDPLVPTPITLSLGGNDIIGTIAAPNDIRDFFTFNIPDGLEFSAIFLIEYVDEATGGDGNTGFIHIDDGTTTVIPDAGNIHTVLGASHIDRALFPNSTDNVLETLAGAPLGGSGFTVPLGPGDYTFNIQQTSSLLTGYRLRLMVVPEPSAALILGLAGFLLLCQRRRSW
jgi:hypothetical protein